MRINRKSGWYINSNIQDKPIEFLVDCGSDCTLIDEAVFSSFSPESEIYLTPVSADFVLADGSPLEVFGEFTGIISIRGKPYWQNVVVANLSGLSGILGLDFIEDHDVRLDCLKVDSK